MAVHTSVVDIGAAVSVCRAPPWGVAVVRAVTQVPVERIALVRFAFAGWRIREDRDTAVMAAAWAAENFVQGGNTGALPAADRFVMEAAAQTRRAVVRVGQ